MTPPPWPWRGRRRKPNEQAGVPAPGSRPEGIGTGAASLFEGDGASAFSGDGLPVARRDGEGDGPVSAERSDAAGAPSSVRVEVSGEGAVGAGRDITHSAIGAGSRVEHTEVDNRIENTTVGRDVVQVGRDLTINHTHHHPAPTPGPVRQPVRVGTVPPLASAFQPRPGLQEQIDRARERNATVVLTQVLSGGGGVGKSQLAAFCVHRAHTDGVDVLVWVDAAETSQIISTYARAAAKAGVPGADGQDAEHDAAVFLDWLAVTDRSWLVVLDDLTDLENTAPWWPRPPAGANGRVLATTRRRDALVTGNGRTIVDIGTYTTTEALTYLHERLTEAASFHLFDDRADDLAEALGRLPLALAHAAAYMINEDVDCTTYLRLFTDRASRLTTLLPPGADTDGYGRQVIASLLVALDAAQQREPAGLATPAIRLAAHLDPAGHPDTLWATDAVTHYLTTHRTPPPTGTPDPGPVTPDQARAALRLLHHYALITHHTHDTHRAVRLHALTARAARETTPPTQLPATVHAAADALFETWPEHEHTAHELTAVLRANTDTLANLAGDHLWHPDGHPVLFTAGNTLTSAGLISAAVTHWQRLAADAERLLGTDAPDTLTARSNLALSYRQAGHTGEAIVLEERVLADRERLLDEDHPDTLTARGNLASSYRRAGRTGEAIDLLERVLIDAERLLGTDAPDTLAARGNLALSYWHAGRTGEAIVLEERVLADAEALFGEDHPDTLIARGNLASSYGRAGRTGEAIVLEERVLADRERLLGHDHPDTLTARGNLALSYWHAGRTGEAIDLLERVLADRERLLGHDHPDTLTACGNLASSYWHAGRTGEATDLLERVLADAERILGHDHPDTRAAADLLRSWRSS
ncbi:NB-ARC domain-containing protein [Streptomyces sp. TLI_053]|uniref:tetratricopeptide repeat protein n=1 Tax=Streptomyces sp. TLI_053 TaxID=1855352 RepID=UPI0008794492|nr:tetratricopeptide repeat protein [Streptomyces sp. TLI_053]SDT83482.1 NB-ARC domain-containing protein [Streptomyces sp. TLI_053]